jgi:hypothetical protein
VAYALRAKSTLLDAPTGLPVRFQLTDLTATSVPVAAGSGDLGAAATQPGGIVNMWYFVVKIKIKALVGVASFSLEVADDTAFATNRRQIAVSGAYTAAVLGTILMDGWSDLEGSVATRYVRVLATFGTSGTYDAEINATPIL